MSQSSSFPTNDHRNYNIKGEAFDVGETFSGVNFDKGLQAVEEIKNLLPDNSYIKSLTLNVIITMIISRKRGTLRHFTSLCLNVVIFVELYEDITLHFKT
jgi:hypothetical protein